MSNTIFEKIRFSLEYFVVFLSGKAINGGFGLVLDGSSRIDEIIKSAMLWDVMGGVARRAWARNKNSIDTVMEYNSFREGIDHITLPYVVKDDIIKNSVKKYLE